MAAAAPELTFRPVTAATRDDLVALFEAKGGPRYCWCMAYRLTPEEKSRAATGAARRPLLLARIARGLPVGLLGYAEGEPVAWVSVAPRETFNRALGGAAPETGETVWSLTCLYLRRQFRGRGAAHQLIAAAIRYARDEGASVLEAYPVDPDSPSYRFMGFVPAFLAAGFEPVGREGTRRHVMRLTLTAGAGAKS